MKFLIVLAFVAAASAEIIYGNYQYPYGVGAVSHHPYAYAGLIHPGLIHPGVVSHQYHAQDELGQYSYGYAGGPSAKHETRTFDGVTRGEYSYIDGHGLVQKAAYVADPINGFRVAASNLPIGQTQHVSVAETPEVAHAKALHFKAHQEALLKLRKRRSPQVIAHPLVTGQVSTVQSNGPVYSGVQAYATPYAHHYASPYSYQPYSYHF